MPPEKKLPVAESADLLFSGNGLPAEEVQMPEWGCAVKIRSLTRAEARAFAELEPEEAEVRAVTLCLVAPAVTEEQARQLLTEKSFGATNRLLERIMEVSGLSGGFPAE